MRYRNLVILAVVTVVVIVAASVVSYLNAPTTGIQKKLLFPGLQKKINDVSEVVIKDSDHTLNLVKKNGTWSIAQADNYPALFDKVKPLIVNMAELRIIEPKTSTPSLYPRLGVEDLDTRGATSHLLTLKDNAGKVLATLLVGKKRKSAAPGDTPGVYVRQPDSKQSLLVEGSLPVSSRVEDWFQKNLFNIKSNRIESIAIHHTDGQVVSLSRENGNDKFKLENIPKGSKPRSDVFLYRMGSIMEGVYAQNVKALDNYQFPDDHATTTIRTFDGLVATVKAGASNGRNYVHYHFDADASKLKKPAGSSSSKDKGAPDKKASADTGKKPDISKEAAKYNKVMADWVYTIPEYKYDLLVETMDKLTQPKGQEKTGAKRAPTSGKTRG
jgi:hypothetical protein